MSDPLYRMEVLRLAADAVGAGRLSGASASASVHNPACGDKVTIDLLVKGGRIVALGHETRACVLAQASAAILGARAQGCSAQDLADLAAQVSAMLREDAGPPPAPFQDYGVFQGAGAFKARHRCVLLPIEAARRAFESAAESFGEAREPGA